MKSPPFDPEALAIAVLGRLAAEPERLERFLALTGLDPASIRRVAGEPGFLVAVLDHALGDEALIGAIAGEIGVPPERIGQARARLAPDPQDAW